MDRQYDGQWHFTAAPYVWLPTLRQNVQYHARVPSTTHTTPVSATVQVGPSDYLSNINAAAMFSFDARKGDWDTFGDYIYTNVSANATFPTYLQGPLGHVKIPATFSTSAHLAASIWEIATGITLAHGHNADLNLFAGWRQFPLNLSLGYNAVLGQRGLIAPHGTVTANPLANDVIFGFRGKAFLDNHWFAPYYADMGVGATNQTWEAFGGGGYAFNHGQTLLLVYRALNYNAFPADSPVQKLSMYGPLLGYTFQI
jgi:hypothetical protein